MVPDECRPAIASGLDSPPLHPTSQSTDWYHEGQVRIVTVDGAEVAVRFVGRKGRRGRIVITAPPGASFRSLDREARGA